MRAAQFSTGAFARTSDAVSFHGVATGLHPGTYRARVQYRIFAFDAEHSKSLAKIDGLQSPHGAPPRRLTVQALQPSDVASSSSVVGACSDTTTSVAALHGANSASTAACEQRSGSSGSSQPGEASWSWIGVDVDWAPLPIPANLRFTTESQSAVLILADLMQSSASSASAFRVVVDGQQVAMSEGGFEMSLAMRGIRVSLPPGEHYAEVQYRVASTYLEMPVSPVRTARSMQVAPNGLGSDWEVRQVWASGVNHNRLTVVHGSYPWCRTVTAWRVVDLQYDLGSAATITPGDQITLVTVRINNTATPSNLPYSKTLTSSTTSEKQWELTENSLERTGVSRDTIGVTTEGSSSRKTSSWEHAVSVKVESPEIPGIGGKVSGGYGYAQGGSESEENFAQQSYSLALGVVSDSTTGIEYEEGRKITETRSVSDTFGPTNLPGCSYHTIEYVGQQVSTTVPFTARMMPTDSSLDECAYDVSGVFTNALVAEVHTTLVTEAHPQLYGSCVTPRHHVEWSHHPDIDEHINRHFYGQVGSETEVAQRMEVVHSFAENATLRLGGALGMDLNLAGNLEVEMNSTGSSGGGGGGRLFGARRTQ